MNETEIIDDSKKENEVSNLKLNKFEYFGLILAIFNLIVIIYIFIVLNNVTIGTYFFGFLFIGILSSGAIITFLKGNPFYIYYFYGFIFTGAIGAYYLFIENPFLMILFIPQWIYLCFLLYNFIYDPYYYTYMRRGQLPLSTQNRMLTSHDQKQRLEEIKTTKLEKKFKANWIVLITILCSIGLLFTMIFSA